MNKVILMGRLTKEPEVRYPSDPGATTVGRFSLAVDRRRTKAGGDTADFFNCTAFGKLAEFTGHYLHKGTKIVLTGRIQNDNYTKPDGQKVYSVQIIADEIEFAESKKAAAENAPAPQEIPTDGFMSIPDDVDDEMLPFN